jgi:hypothetical protein
MFDPNCIKRCDFCKRGHVTTRHEQVSFHQWTDKGYVFCRADVPIGVCNRCSSKHWNQNTETIVEDAVQQEYQKLRCF